MDVQEQEFSELKQVADLVEEIKFAMLTTEESDGTLRSRPMATMQMDAVGNLWFFTALSSPKMEEAQHHCHVNLSYAHPDKQDYLSLSGNAEIVRDKEKMRSLWTSWIEPWFPKGLDDPDLVLLKVTITGGEYWTAPGNAAERLYGLAKGMLTGNTSAMGDHHKLVM